MPNPLIIIFRILVHPDLGQSDGVPPEDIDPGPPLVRGALAEDVANMAARDDLKGPPTHPSFEAELQVFTACIYKKSI